jgi:hypothetical protein
VTQRTVVVANLMGLPMAVTAYIVETLKVGPVVAGKAVCRGVIARKLHWMHPQLRFSPGIGRGVTVFARHGNRQVVGTHVAGVTVGKPGIQIALDVAVQADCHGTDDFACDRIESMPHLPMAIATEYTTRRTLPDRVNDLAVRGAQMILRDLIGEMAVAKQAILWMGLTEIGEQALMRRLFVRFVSCSTVAGDATQAAMRGLQGSWLDVGNVCVLCRRGTGGQGLGVKMAIFAFAGKGAGVANRCECWHGRDLWGQGLA